MATKTITLQICDVCGAEGNLDTYRIGGPVGNVRRIDLCPTDAKPFRDILGAVRPARTRKTRRVLDDETQIPT